ncbi:class I adenylate-forming enzyme family protein [Herbaspirillum rubrisubalbicans]|uniref:class I adenylate-forming enzyme family protein n=1 Tax=Herbaspirillum rubrisubalbicans TaxID=80842 RepID=UPI001559A3FE|nr:long-chain fatty acid--CoA ligase [Herbaspirillum rubrisubalbicans]NQE47238.1 AMP-dependent synthetase [Herbaspirillum rubrisubalbicans]
MKTLGEIIERNARFYPDKEALVDDRRRVTYAQLLKRAKRLSSTFYANGLRRQDRVAILSMNCVEYYEAYRACELAGYILATVNFRLVAREIAWILKDAAPRVLIFEAQYTTLVEELRATLPDVELFICIGAAPAWAMSFEDAMAAGSAEGPSQRATPQDYAYLLYTSGTTGHPKGVVRTHAAMCTTAEICAMSSEFHSGTRLLQTTPAFHVGGIGYVNSAAWVGGTTVIQRGFDPVGMLRAIESESITFTFMVAAMLQAVLDVPGVQDYKLSSIEGIVTAAAPVPVPLLVRGIELLGPVFSVQYGMTEANACALPRTLVQPVGTPEQVRRLASVGHPQARVELRIVDDHDNDCAPGEKGEVWLRTDTQLSGYWNNSPATVEALRDGWYRTGDMGYQDDEGYVFLIDRKKDMIISGGENIYSREVEDALLEHPAVQEVAVIGVPHEKWGECVKAIVVLRPGRNVEETDLISHCRGQIASYKCPKSVAFVNELPRIATGKVSKAALRERYGQPAPQSTDL